MFGRLRVGPTRVDVIRHPLSIRSRPIEQANGAAGVGVRGHGEPGAVRAPSLRPS